MPWVILLLLGGGVLAMKARAKPAGGIVARPIAGLPPDFPLSIPPMPGPSKIPADQSSREAYEKLRDQYLEVPVIGAGFVAVMDLIVEAFGFAESTAAADLADMRAFDDWRAAVAQSSEAVRAAAQNYATLLGQQFGDANVLRLSMDPTFSEVVTAEATRTGTAPRLSEPFWTVNGWGEWYELLFSDPPALPKPSKGWRKYQKALGEKEIGILEAQSLGALYRFDRMIADFSKGGST